MKPRIKIDRFAPGWICHHFATNTRGSGATPAEAFAAWKWHVARISLLALPVIDPSLIPEKETTNAQ